MPADGTRHISIGGPRVVVGLCCFAALSRGGRSGVGPSSSCIIVVIIMLGHCLLAKYYETWRWWWWERRERSDELAAIVLWMIIIAVAMTVAVSRLIGRLVEEAAVIGRWLMSMSSSCVESKKMKNEVILIVCIFRWEKLRESNYNKFRVNMYLHTYQCSDGRISNGVSA